MRIPVFDRHPVIALLTRGAGDGKTDHRRDRPRREPAAAEGTGLRPLQRDERRPRHRRPGRDVRRIGLSRKPDGRPRPGLRDRRGREQPDRIAVRPGFDGLPLEPLGNLSAGHPPLLLDGRDGPGRARVPERRFSGHGAAGHGDLPQGLPMAVRSAQGRGLRLLAHRPPRLPGDRRRGPARLPGFRPESRPVRTALPDSRSTGSAPKRGPTSSGPAPCRRRRSSGCGT